jgi:hypothetical protein
MIHGAMKRGALGMDITKKEIPTDLLEYQVRSHNLNLHVHQAGNPWS